MPTVKFRAIGGAVTALAIALCSLGDAGAASFPDRTIKIVVPFAAGGGTDVVARLFSDALAKQLNGTVIVENKPGAAGLIGANEVAKSAADGYTLLFTPQNTITIAPHLDHPISYNPAKDLVPISMVAQQPIIFVANKDLPAKNLKEFVALAKKEEGKLNYGSPGPSTELNLSVQLLNQEAGIKATHIAYRGGSPAVTALLRGDIQMLPIVPSAIGPFIESGKVTPLATTAPARIDRFPQIPTTKEMGYPEVNVLAWWGVFARAGTPSAILDRLQVAAKAIQADAQYKEKLKNMSVEAMAVPANEFSKMLTEETARWGRVIKAAGLHLQ